jgi:uncharacterized protein (UPF0254 family)
MDKSGIKVRIFDIENGLREYKDIKIIRIISKDYNLLIMKDYLPIIGEIEGSVDIKNDEVNLSFKDIKAFYMNSNNEFNLMIKEAINKYTFNISKSFSNKHWL